MKNVLCAQGFGAAFGERVVLAEVDLALSARGVTALIGPTGTGKSTLLRAWAGLNDRNPRYRWWGTVDYRDAVLADDNRPLLVQQHARLMQASVLDALSAAVRERQVLASGVQLREWAASLVEELGVPELAMHFDKSTIDLSSVQQRMVSIVRESACLPALLLVDEPTFGLADHDASLLLELLRVIGEHNAVLLVLHNQKHVRRVASRVALLAGGRIQECSPVDEFFNAPQSEAARQFVVTGSCALPAPDADPQTLAEDVAPPPPLPLMAKLAMRAAPESMGPRGFTWIVPGKLAGTPMPGVVHDIDYDLHALKAVGITCLITLTERDLPQEALRRNGLTNLHLPIIDREPPSVAQTTMLLMRMETLLNRGGVLAVHCLAGIGRTGTVLAAWLIREGLTAQEALKRVRRIEPKFVQSEEQEDFLQVYENAILKKIV